ncbi:MAG TPA: methylaspartate mutase accessory protein GlmL [Usitatibacter sp.]|nr:methylaspartate mutase accessory protein GlmL [Usitatibacter sp.]
MDPILAVDFGSTYTKAALIDRAAAQVVASAHAPSTVGSDVTLGLRQVLSEVSAKVGRDIRKVPALACSSAAGGLRVAIIGLVPALSLEAARRAALGAGAKIIAAYGYKLTAKPLADLERLAPDIVLLAGGTDGGDEETILHNARLLARSPISAPIVVAGNQVVQQECLDLLQAAGKPARPADNLLPEVGRIEVRSVHDIIRDLFIHRITHAKGIDRVRDYLDLVADIVPTPSAVLEAARLVSEGTAKSKGLGDTVVIDVGGATTDVHSVASGAPTRPGVVVRGLPELRLKRTVEGDLGMRINAATIVERYGRAEVFALAEALQPAVAMAEEDVDRYTAHVSARTEHIPADARERSLDCALGRAAVRLAMQRHAGAIRQVYTHKGPVPVQEGKDLGEVAAIIGVGGVLAHGADARFVLEGALDSGTDPFSLLPRNAALYLDRRYVLYGIGLLAGISEEAALATAHNVLEEL